MRILFSLAFSIFAVAQARAAETPAPQTEEQKTLYALGLWSGSKLPIFNLSTTELKYVEMGLRDAALSRKPMVDINVYGAKINELAQARASVKAEGQKKKEKVFYDKFAKEKGVMALPSGLLFKMLKAGSGASPGAADTVKANYTGTLTDGTVFDSSSNHGGPLEFPLSGVIPCWTEGMQKLKVGGKARLVCPSSIAYGDAGSPPAIPGGATLIFEVELVDIVKKK